MFLILVNVKREYPYNVKKTILWRTLTKIVNSCHEMSGVLSNTGSQDKDKLQVLEEYTTPLRSQAKKYTNSFQILYLWPNESVVSRGPAGRCILYPLTLLNIELCIQLSDEMSKWIRQPYLKERIWLFIHIELNWKDKVTGPFLTQAYICRDFLTSQCHLIENEYQDFRSRTYLYGCNQAQPEIGIIASAISFWNSAL